MSPNSRFIVGHVRLAILGVGESGSQPTVDRDDRVLAYNGEIYNHLALRQSLGRGVQWRGSSDTETLSALLADRGEAGLDDCEGMFAGVHFDRSRDRIILFRDSLGIKPLFTMIESDGTVVFGSEVDALLALLGSGRRAIDGAVLRSLLAYQNLPPGRSLLTGIRPLRPGEILAIEGPSAGLPRTRSSMINVPPGIAHDDVSSSDPAVVRDTLEKSIRSHLLSERPVGAYLSGGIDSTIVAGVAARSGKAIEAFTGWFDPGPASDDERALARETANTFGLNLHEIAIRPDDFATHFDDLIRHLGEPRMGTGTIAQFMVAREASKYVRVVLAGHGGDELFGGYPIHQSAMGISQGRLLEAVSRTSGRRRAVTIWAILGYLRRRRLPFAPRIFDVSVDPSIVTDFESHGRREEILRSVDRYYRNVYLPGLLEVEDRISMAHGLETRLPLWTQPIVDWIFRLDSERRFGDRPKALLREAFDDLLPESVKHAPKRGFPTPFASWFRGPCREFVESRLSAWPPILESVVPLPMVRRMVSGHMRRPLPGLFDERRANRLWILLQLEAWVRRFKPEAIVDTEEGGGIG